MTLTLIAALMCNVVYYKAAAAVPENTKRRFMYVGVRRVNYNCSAHAEVKLQFS